MALLGAARLYGRCMADEIDAQELLERIRRARDWAEKEADADLSYDGEGDNAEFAALAASIRGSALRVVQEAFERILNPHPPTESD